MQASELLWREMKRSRVVALLSPRSEDACLHVYEALHPLGIVLEIALRTDAALGGIEAVRSRYPDALLLAGTVMTPDQARRAIALGAAGIVSPDYFPSVVELCCEQDVMCVPGGLADVGKQLVQKAEHYGCTLETLRERHPHQWIYKLFPAMSGDLALLNVGASWRAIYHDLTILYTGGVTGANVHEVARRDPDGIVCGSALTRPADDIEAMKAEAEHWLSALCSGDAGAEPRSS